MPGSNFPHPEIAAAFALNGRIAIVTGAASGIGRETARVLSWAGAHVYIADIDEAGLAETRKLIGPDAVTPLRTDVADRAQLQALADAALAAKGRIDVWVNCAAMVANVPIVDTSEAQLDRVIAVNLKAVYAGCAIAGQAMMAQGAGSIINLSSAGAESAIPGLSAYSLTKAAVNAITRTAAREFGPRGVRVNAVAPGWVETPMGFQSIVEADGRIDPVKRAALLKNRAEMSPLGLAGAPRDIALAILYLAADASRFVTGQILRPNGGIAMP